MSGALSTFADLELASDDPPFESEPAWFSYEDECMPDDENDDLLDVDDEDECMPRALRTPQLRLPGIVSLAESCTPSVFTDAGMLDGEMLLPNAVAPEHAAAVSGPAHRPSRPPSPSLHHAPLFTQLRGQCRQTSMPAAAAQRIFRHAPSPRRLRGMRDRRPCAI
jgi:hypothetical protein